jgi:hypothetical protein
VGPGRREAATAGELHRPDAPGMSRGLLVLILVTLVIVVLLGLITNAMA